MNGKWIKRILGMALVAVIAAGFIYALMPQPVAVDAATIDRGPMEATIDEEGMTRIRDIYVVSAPVGGKVRRTSLTVGDPVQMGETTVAVLQPVDPSFLDIRTRRELEAAIEAARAAVALADAEISRAKSELQLAESDLQRALRLAETRTISERSLEQAKVDVETRKAELRQAESNLLLRERELESAEARLLQPGALPDDALNNQCCVVIPAPVSGVVLRIVAESEQVVPAGAPLLEIGDPSDLEIVVDLLSDDAVRVDANSEAHIEAWGGGETLSAVVRRVDPTGFTKVSALGIEEQRVKAVLDLVDPLEKWTRLGHEFRVFVRIRIWSGDNVVRAPLGALFRVGPDWAVYRISEGRAELVRIGIDHRNDRHAEVVSGLAPGDMVILHPSDLIGDGVEVTIREDGTGE